MKKILTFLLCLCLVLPVAGCRNNKNLTIPTYKMQLELDNDTLNGQMQVEFELKANGYVDFNLFGASYRQNAEYFAVEKEYLPANKQYGDMQILSVSASCFVGYEILQDKSLLRVYLNAKKGQTVTVYIQFLVKLSNFSHRLSYGEQTVNLGNFYPILCVYENGYYFCPYYNLGDPFYSEVANYSVELVCDSQYTVASSGFCQNVDYLRSKTKYLYTLENARDFAFCLSKDFKVAFATLNNVEIFYYYLTDDCEKDLQLIKECLTFFNAFYPYPYKTYSVAQSDFCYGGMEYPALTYVNKSLGEEDKYLTIAHETAHQWWYGLVGNNQITNACLDEGLTEFSTILFFENYKNYNISSKNLVTQKITNYAYFVEAYKIKYGMDMDFSATRSLNQYKNSIDYTYTAYYYMPYCFYRLYKGDFLYVLNCFAQDYAYKIATLQDFGNYLNSADKIYYDLALKGYGLIFD